MGKTFTKSENTKKAAGNAKKAAAAADKQAKASAEAAALEDQDWARGSKSSSKKDDAAAKKAEAAAKKAERDAQLAEEESSARSTPKNSKSAAKKVSVAPARGLNLAQLDEGDGKSGSSSLPALNASGIDNALDALTLTGSSAAADAGKIDRHPERRFKAAYTAYETKRLVELEAENPGLRRNQRVEIVRREFAKHPDNPFNQATGRFDSTGAELKEIADRERTRMEGMLGGS